MLVPPDLLPETAAAAAAERGVRWRAPVRFPQDSLRSLSANAKLRHKRGGVLDSARSHNEWFDQAGVSDALVHVLRRHGDCRRGHYPDAGSIRPGPRPRRVAAGDAAGRRRPLAAPPVAPGHWGGAGHALWAAPVRPGCRALLGPLIPRHPLADGRHLRLQRELALPPDRPGGATGR